MDRELHRAVTVRAAREAEVDALARLWHDGWQDAHCRIVPVELARVRTVASFSDRLRAGLDRVRVAGPMEKPVGFCMIRGDELYQLYVAAPARGSGVAAALMDDAESRLRAGGARAAWLACAIGNQRAARFYEKCGWRLDATVVIQCETTIGDFPLQVWRYEKRLRA